ncbi:MAG: hypothetical protein QM539_04515 [Alphaproteobacteria bacterium]|nr:hypothetical protein [Alphaproteobacteria bacterium]
MMQAFLWKIAGFDPIFLRKHNYGEVNDFNSNIHTISGAIIFFMAIMSPLAFYGFFLICFKSKMLSTLFTLLFFIILFFGYRYCLISFHSYNYNSLLHRIFSPSVIFRVIFVLFFVFFLCVAILPVMYNNEIEALLKFKNIDKLELVVRFELLFKYYSKAYWWFIFWFILFMLPAFLRFYLNKTYIYRGFLAIPVFLTHFCDDKNISVVSVNYDDIKALADKDFITVEDKLFSAYHLKLLRRYTNGKIKNSGYTNIKFN